MAKITEQDIVSFLEQRVSQLSAELNKAQLALQALSQGDFTASSPSVSKAVRNVEGEAKVGKDKKVKPLVAPGSYGDHLTLEKKIAFILSQESPLFNVQIIEKLQAMETDKDPDKISKAVMVKLSSLYKANRIKAQKEGRKFQYELY